MQSQVYVVGDSKLHIDITDDILIDGVSLCDLALKDFSPRDSFLKTFKGIASTSSSTALIESLREYRNQENALKHKNISLNQITSPLLLSVLAASSLRLWQAEAAQNKNTPGWVLEELARTNQIVGITAASNSSMSEAFLIRSAMNPDYTLAKGLLLNPALTDKQRIILLRRAVKDSSLNDPPRGLLIFLLSLASATYDKDDLVILARCKYELVRRLVARNPHVDSRALKILSLDELALIRALVAGNPKTSKPILGKLALDIEFEVRRSALNNPNIPITMLEILRYDRVEEIAARAEERMDLIRARRWAGDLKRKKTTIVPAHDVGAMESV